MPKDKGLPLTSTHWGTYRAKVKDGKVCFVIPRNIGEVEITNDIDNLSIKECISRLIHWEQ